MCTQECLVLGHSDNCWMPPTLGSYQHPKSPVSSFSSQREWGQKDKLLNGHTLSRTWKNESGRSEHFGDRKQFGSGEGHFTSSSMADIPLVSLKSCQSASCPDSPKDQQL
uniref:PCDH9 protein n=2 Tax=Poecilia TaxID=8080 RepID=A0A3B3XY52_9TELE